MYEYFILNVDNSTFCKKSNIKSFFTYVIAGFLVFWNENQ